MHRYWAKLEECRKSMLSRTYTQSQEVKLT